MLFEDKSPLQAFLSPKELKELVLLSQGKARQVDVGLPEAAAEAFAKIRNKKRQEELIQKAAGLNEQTRERLKYLLSKPSSVSPPPDEFATALEQISLVHEEIPLAADEAPLTESEQAELRSLQDRLLEVEFQFANLLQDNELVQKILKA